MLDFQEYSKEIMDRLTTGRALMTTKANGRINTMVIGWGGVNKYFGDDIFIAPVRLSRYTHDLLDDSDVFTVSFPKDMELVDALKICGTKSGRDMDKFQVCNLTAVQGRMVDCPIIGEGWLHMECKVVGQTTLSGENLDAAVMDKIYKSHDLHTLYLGKVVALYTLD